jgi:hypothetical protein
MKKLTIVTSALLLVIGIYLTQSTVNSKTPSADATYKDSEQEWEDIFRLLKSGLIPLQLYL